MSRMLGVSLLVASVALSSANAQWDPPKDCEIRTSRDTFSNDNLTTLTLALSGPQGPQPINLAITTVRKAHAQAGTPAEVRLDFDMPLFVGQLDFRRPHVVLALDAGTKAEHVSTFSVEATANIPVVNRVTVPFDAAALARLAQAKSIAGRIFGAEFALTARQLRAIQDLAQRELR